jgi:hypothetical protein
MLALQTIGFERLVHGLDEPRVTNAVARIDFRPSNPALLIDRMVERTLG